jgi:hypothetical protein
MITLSVITLSQMMTLPVTTFIEMLTVTVIQFSQMKTLSVTTLNIFHCGYSENRPSPLLGTCLSERSKDRLVSCSLHMHQRIVSKTDLAVFYFLFVTCLSE